MLYYPPRGHRRASVREVRRIRPERHNPHSIATLPYQDRASTAAATASLPVLRIAASIVVGIYLDVLHATLSSMGFGPPGTLYQFHSGELDQRQATPDPLLAARQWSALGVSPVLITEHTPLTRLVVTHHMRTQEPPGALIPRRNRLVSN